MDARAAIAFTEPMQFRYEIHSRWEHAHPSPSAPARRQHRPASAIERHGHCSPRSVLIPAPQPSNLVHVGWIARYNDASARRKRVGKEIRPRFLVRGFVETVDISSSRRFLQWPSYVLATSDRHRSTVVVGGACSGSPCAPPNARQGRERTLALIGVEPDTDR